MEQRGDLTLLWLEKLLEAWELVWLTHTTTLTFSLFGFLSLSIVPRGGGYLVVDTDSVCISKGLSQFAPEKSLDLF